MTRTNRAGTAAAAVAAALLAAPALGWGQDATAPAAADPAKLDALEGAVRTLTAEPGSRRAELDALRAELAERDAAERAARDALAARDARLQGLGGELAAATERVEALERELAAARGESVAQAEAQRALTEEAETVAASAAALELQLSERNAALDRQRAELMAARNDLASAERALAVRDREVAALAAAGRELVSERDAVLAGSRAQLLATRNDLASAQAQLAVKDREIAALVAAGRELVAGGEQLAASNRALEQRLQGLTGPGQAFLDALSGAFGPGSGVRVEDGRVIFPTDLAFEPGSPQLTPEARAKALEYARAVAAAVADLPADRPWVLRVDGHTDRRPVGGGRFESNRALAVARALEVVEILNEAGVPPERVVPAAFGEFRPLDPANTPEAYRANRRIELSLDER
jgi:chemotaxis protein MotB